MIAGNLCCNCRIPQKVLRLNSNKVLIEAQEFNFNVLFTDGTVEGFKYGDHIVHPKNPSLYIADIVFVDFYIEKYA